MDEISNRRAMRLWEKRYGDDMTVDEVFQSSNLSPIGPICWETNIPAKNAGVYVIARVNNPHGTIKSIPLRFVESFPSNIGIERAYECQRWLADEPIIYIGQTGDIRTRLTQLYDHTVGEKRPHAGGQIIKLLQADKWVFWAPCSNHAEVKRAMIEAFKSRNGSPPFGNDSADRKGPRLSLLS